MECKCKCAFYIQSKGRYCKHGATTGNFCKRHARIDAISTDKTPLILKACINSLPTSISKGMDDYKLTKTDYTKKDMWQAVIMKGVKN